MISRNVYIIAEQDGPRKIGMSVNPDSRMLDFRTGRAPLSVVATYPRDTGDARTVERVAHQLLKEKRLGGEWFDVTDDEAIAAVREAIDLVESGDLSILSPGTSTTTRITVSLPTDLVALLDAEAKASDRTASAIVRRALRAVLPSQFESPPLGGQGHATLPGTPATAAVRGVIGPNGSTAAAQDAPFSGAGTAAGRASPASSGGGFPLQESIQMADTPLREINAEARSPAPEPRGSGTDVD